MEWAPTVILIGIFAWLLFKERRSTKRDDEFFNRTDSQMDDLADRTWSRYRSRHGREPTLTFPPPRRGDARHPPRS